MGGLRIQTAGQRDVAALKAFLKGHYDCAHPLLDEGYFNHWFSPQGGDLSVIVAFINDTVVGFQGLIERTITWRGAEAPAAWYCHTYVDTQYRGRGIGLKLLEHSVNAYENILTISYTDQAGALLRRMGFEFFSGGALRRYWRLLDSRAFSCLPHAALPSGNLRPRPADDPPASTRIFEPDAQLDRDWLGVAPLLGLTTARSADYLRARYFSHPVHDYHVLVPPKRGGCAVIRFEPHTMPMAARVVDLWGAQESVTRLLIDAAAYAAERGACFVDYYTTSAIYEKPLCESGFEALNGDAAWQVPYLFNPPEPRTRYNERLAARLTGLRDGGPRLIDECYFTKGDGDRDR